MARRWLFSPPGGPNSSRLQSDPAGGECCCLYLLQHRHALDFGSWRPSCRGQRASAISVDARVGAIGGLVLGNGREEGGRWPAVLVRLWASFRALTPGRRKSLRSRVRPAVLMEVVTLAELGSAARSQPAISSTATLQAHRSPCSDPDQEFVSRVPDELVAINKVDDRHRRRRRAWMTCRQSMTARPRSPGRSARRATPSVRPVPIGEIYDYVRGAGAPELATILSWQRQIKLEGTP